MNFLSILKFLGFCCLASLALVQPSFSLEPIVGTWKLQTDRDQLLDLGMVEEDIDNSALEIRFHPDGNFEMRVVDPGTFDNTAIHGFSGSYYLEGDFLRKSLSPGIWESQRLSISGDEMTLTPVEYEGKVVNRLKRIERWSLVE